MTIGSFSAKALILLLMSGAACGAESGITFASEQIRALQADDAANPGMLWITRGETLWNEPAGDKKYTCAGCHGDAKTSMKAVAARYPKLTENQTKVINLEARINQCRVEKQSTLPLVYDSPELLALTAYISHQSRGMPRSPVAPGSLPMRRGEALFSQRMGQMNLACIHCHEQNAGKTLLAEKISQGQSNAYPIYRLEWQTMGSLHRRLRSCMAGVRAEPFVSGSEEFLALEPYLAARGSNLLIETPGVRR